MLNIWSIIFWEGLKKIVNINKRMDFIRKWMGLVCCSLSRIYSVQKMNKLIKSFIMVYLTVKEFGVD
jgi:hypothetical protein